MAPIFTGAARGFAGFAFGNTSSGISGPTYQSTGGDYVTAPGNGFVYHTFITPGNFVSTEEITNAEVLIVGGGGGGASFSNSGNAGAGGGAGGVIYHSSLTIGAGTSAIGVGTGGREAYDVNYQGFNGESSTAFEMTALGGGGAGGYTSGARPGGGSGGGGTSGGAENQSSENTPFQPDPNFAQYGNAGGSSSPGQGDWGGGGGAGTSGYDYETPNKAGDGGQGRLFADFVGPLIGMPALEAINGWYGGGGGGGDYPSLGAVGGGIGGGGGSNNPSVADVSASNFNIPAAAGPGIPGTDGTGGGGAGGVGVYNGGKGGNGIVVIKYAYGAPAGTVAATGGSETLTPGDGYKYHFFTSDDNFNVTSGGNVEYIIIGGGGAGCGQPGGNNYGGGGAGAGGVRSGSIKTSAQTYPFVVGPTASGTNSYTGVKGNPSSAFSVIAYGGGAGGGYNSPGADFTGGSGGGAPHYASTGIGTGGKQTGTMIDSLDIGSPGGRGGGTASGGGGGAGGMGKNSFPTPATGGRGGVGISFPDWTIPSGYGTPNTKPLAGRWFAGGGGGGGNTTAGAAPFGGGGGVGGASGNAGDATANTGGGGGSTSGSGDLTGGDGGSGIIIVRYEV